jgi:hypothetical protein
MEEGVSSIKISLLSCYFRYFAISATTKEENHLSGGVVLRAVAVLIAVGGGWPLQC